MMQEPQIFPKSDRYLLEERLRLGNDVFDCLRCLHHLDGKDHDIFVLKHDGENYYSFLFCKDCDSRYSKENLVKRIVIPRNSSISEVLAKNAIFKEVIEN